MSKEPKTYKNQSYLSTVPSCYHHDSKREPVTKELLLDVLGDYCNFYRCDWNSEIEEYSMEKLLEKYWDYSFSEDNAASHLSSNKCDLWHSLYTEDLEKDCPKMTWWVFGDLEDASDGSFDFDEKYWEFFMSIVKTDSGNNTKVDYIGYGPDTDYIYANGVVDYSDVVWSEIPSKLQEELLKDANYIKVDSLLPASNEEYRVCIYRSEAGFWMENPDDDCTEDYKYLWYDFFENNDFFYFTGYKKDGVVVIDENSRLHNLIFDC